MMQPAFPDLEHPKLPWKPRRLWYWLGAIAIVGFLLLYGAFVGLSWWIQSQAHAFAARAMETYEGNEVDALLSLVQSESEPMAERNRAVHALGQIGNPRALTVLEALYTGGPCQHDRYLCQYELEKAIDRCQGKNWAPRWVPFVPHVPESSDAS